MARRSMPVVCLMLVRALHSSCRLASARRGSLASPTFYPCALFLTLRPLGGVRWSLSELARLLLVRTSYA